MNNASPSRIITAIVLIGLGAGFLFDALGLFEFSQLISNGWPLLIVLAGVLSLVSSPKAPLWPSLIILFGALLFLRQIDVVDFNVWSLIWPAAIIGVGLNLLFDKLGDKPHTANGDSHDLSAILSGHNSRNTSDDYRGGKLTAVLGGIELDLSKATIKKEAYIDAFCLMGGVELRVPEGWEVQTSGLPILGGWENKAAKPTVKDAPKLIIRGTCIMGGVEIKN